MTRRGARHFTNKVIDAMNEGALDPRKVADAAMAYMSEADVEDMAQCEGLLPDDEFDEPEETDDD